MMRFREFDLTLASVASMQFLGCPKMLSYKWLWRVLSSSVASMKGCVKTQTAGKKPRKFGVLRGVSVCAGWRDKSFENLGGEALPKFTDPPNWLFHHRDA